MYTQGVRPRNVNRNQTKTEKGYTFREPELFLLPPPPEVAPLLVVEVVPASLASPFEALPLAAAAPAPITGGGIVPDKKI